MAAKRFDKAHKALTDKIERVMERYHPRLAELEIAIETLLVYGPRNKEGIQTGPAITVRGREAYACIRITKLEERIAGRGDAVLWIDGDRYKKIEPDTMDAILDHEITHLQLVEDFKEDQDFCTDDAGRVRLRLRPHDFEVGWFHEVAERHGLISIESQQFFDVAAKQQYFPGFEFVATSALEVTKKRIKSVALRAKQNG